MIINFVNKNNLYQIAEILDLFKEKDLVVSKYYCPIRAARILKDS